MLWIGNQIVCMHFFMSVHVLPDTFYVSTDGTLFGLATNMQNRAESDGIRGVYSKAYGRFLKFTKNWSVSQLSKLAIAVSVVQSEFRFIDWTGNAGFISQILTECKFTKSEITWLTCQSTYCGREYKRNSKTFGDVVIWFRRLSSPNTRIPAKSGRPAKRTALWHLAPPQESHYWSHRLSKLKAWSSA